MKIFSFFHRITSGIKPLSTYAQIRYRFVHHRLRLIFIVCLIAITAVTVQPFLANSADAFAGKPSANYSSNISRPPSGKISAPSLPSTSHPNPSKPTYIAGNWQSWEGDEKWFMDNFCNSGSKKYCFANKTWISSGKVEGSNMRITGMAAGFDTRARIVIQAWGCKFLSCAWRTRVDEILQPRTYKTWTYSASDKRTVRIDPVGGEARVHLAVTYGVGNSPSVGQPQITVSKGGGGFTISGSGFLANRTVFVHVTDDALNRVVYQQSADSNGRFTLVQQIPCISGLRLNFTATDGRAWSNTFNTSC